MLRAVVQLGDEAIVVADTSRALTRLLAAAVETLRRARDLALEAVSDEEIEARLSALEQELGPPPAFWDVEPLRPGFADLVRRRIEQMRGAA